jgi:hypothetical protein
MLGFLCILAATIAGMMQTPPWTIGAAAIALAALSRAEYATTYQDGERLGRHALLDRAMIESLANATLVSAAAYGGGYVIMML